MTEKELKRIFSKGECLSLDALRLYNDGKLNKKSMHEVEKHLLECNLCSGAVDGLNSKRIVEVDKLSSHIQRRLAVYMNTPPQVSFFRRFGFLIITCTVVIGSLSTWWFVAQSKTKNIQPVSNSTSSKHNNQPESSSESTTNVSIPTENQNANDVVASDVNENKSNQVVYGKVSSKSQNLPAVTPAQTNTTHAVKEETVTTPVTNTTESSDGPNTRTGNANQPIHIRSVQIYPAVTHNDKQARNDAKDGQLGRSGGSSAVFELDEMPFFPGGTEALRNYIINNFKPTLTDRSKLTRYSTGFVFVVNSKTGAISGVELSFGISPEVDKELLRVINSMPNWSPGKKRGEVDIMIGVTFE